MPTSPSVVSGESPGEMLRLIRMGHAATRAELAEVTGLARSTVSARIEALMAAGLLREIGGAPSTGGRPPAILGFNAEAGVVLVADLGATHSRLAVSDLAATPIAETSGDFDIGEGPERVIEWVIDEFTKLLDRAGRSPGDVRGIGIGVPGPVDFDQGQAVNPPIMPGWDGYPIREPFAARYGAPVLVDNDVNIMALGEYWVGDQQYPDFLFLKIGTGIGSGLILGGRLHRGDKGAAGDIGHVQVGPAHVVCRCGNTGCLEASAGGGALAARLREAGLDSRDSRDVVRFVRSGDETAVRAVREAGRLVGQVLAMTVNLLNPGLIMIGGDLAKAEPHLLAGIRETVYRRSTTLSTMELQMTTTTLGDRAGITGAAAMAIDAALSPRSVDAVIQRMAVEATA